MIISESDQKILNSYTSMIQQSMKEAATHPKNPETQLADYRAMMLKINPYKSPPGYKSKPVASFQPKLELRPGLTAAVSIPHGKGPFPVIVHAHGHGLRAGSPPEYEPWIREMSSYGFVVMFPDYRWQTEHTYEDQVEDMNFALRWVKDNAAKIQADPNKLIIGGDSAGGGLAMDVMMRHLQDPNGLRFKAFATVDGIILGQTKPDGSNNLTALKPETPFPPVVMVVGSADGLSRGILEGSIKMLEAKKDYDLSVFYGMPHDFAKFPQLEVMHEANRRMMEFLKRAV